MEFFLCKNGLCGHYVYMLFLFIILFETIISRGSFNTSFQNPLLEG